VARAVYEAAREVGADALDAPVSGGDVGAREGTLSIMVGGSDDAFKRAEPLFDVDHMLAALRAAGDGGPDHSALLKVTEHAAGHEA
jgi:3-hydroxyisobutyrate dehydrogenase-like beta-hydroxyacid dehydrogenase